MTDLVTTARTARERLSVGLNALQNPGLPESLQAAAEPIAQAMSMLLQIERTGTVPISKGGPTALDFVRQALAKLQSQPLEHPALFEAMEAVAGSLGLVYGLVQRISSVPPAGSGTANSSNPQKLVASAAVAVAPRVAPSQAVATSSQAAVANAASIPRPQVTGSGMPAASIPRPQPVQPEVANIQPQNAQGTMLSSRQAASASVPDAIAAAMQIPAGVDVTGVANAQTMLASGTQLSSSGAAPPAAKTPSSPPPMAQASGALAPIAASGTGLPRVAAELGAHSPSNFYKGLSGNDVVDSGGIFVATYQVPPIGKSLLIRVSLPGGYEFEAKGVVRWTREASSIGGDSVSPGFGAQFTEISPEARQLVYRYARNREPLFHDDL